MTSPERPPFKIWLANFRNVDLPIGDLAKDILSDEDFPDSEDYYTLLCYLAEKAPLRIQDKVIDAFRVTWEFYLASA